MNEVTKYAPGTFCWENLYTTDMANARYFYQNLFGWKVENVQVEEKQTHSTFSVKGSEVCGFSEMNETQLQQQTPSHWKTYISVPDVDEFVKIAKVAGGIILEPPKTNMNFGRSVLIQDPIGAIFYLWEPHNRIGALVSDISGTACWRELETTNIDVAGKFYSTLFAWNPRPEKFGDMAYVTFKLGPKSVGGMIAIQKEVTPAHWLTYWNVKDCEKSTLKTVELGGKILKSPTTIKRVGQFAVLADPQGAVFAILQPESSRD